jgi:hypothetical protein
MYREHPKQNHHDGRQYPYDDYKHNQMPMNGNSLHRPDRSPRHHGEPDSPSQGLPKNAGLQYDRVSLENEAINHCYYWSCHHNVFSSRMLF